MVTYTALISACNKGRQWERALAVNQEMQLRGVRENEVTYSTLVEAAGNAGQVQSATHPPRLHDCVMMPV